MTDPAPKKKRGGPRPNSGRKKGTRNRATIERETKAMQQQLRWQNNKAIKNGQPYTIVPKLGREVLETLMMAAYTYAVQYDKAQNLGKFQEWAKLACAWARDLAPYQSPTFRAISVMTDRDAEKNEREKQDTIASLEDIREYMKRRGYPVDQVAKALLAIEVDAEIEEIDAEVKGG